MSALTDAQRESIPAWCVRCTTYHDGKVGEACDLPARYLALRAFLTGGPCETCVGLGTRLVIYPGPNDTREEPCPNPDCVNGRVPGLIERLESGEDAYALIDAARRMVEP